MPLLGLSILLFLLVQTLLVLLVVVVPATGLLLEMLLVTAFLLLHGSVPSSIHFTLDNDPYRIGKSRGGLINLPNDIHPS